MERPRDNFRAGILLTEMSGPFDRIERRPGAAFGRWTDVFHGNVPFVHCDGIYNGPAVAARLGFRKNSPVD